MYEYWDAEFLFDYLVSTCVVGVAVGVYYAFEF